MPPEHIFLSYRSTEREFASKLRNDLEKSGVTIWMDDHGGIEGGDDWRQAIQDAVDSAVAMITVISPEYLESKWCMREINRADSNNIPILPVYIKKVDKFPIVIEGIQYINFRDALTDENEYQQQLAELIEQIGDKTSVKVDPSKSAKTRSVPQRKWRFRWGWVEKLSALLLTLIGLAIGILQLSDERLQLIRDTYQNVFAPRSAALFRPSVEAFSLAVEREALYRDLNDVSSPQSLVVAPYSGGQAVWGYGAANHILFAADVGTGDSVAEIDLREQFGDEFLARSMYYDGRWLWISGADNRITSLDPITLDNLLEYTLSGEPTAMTHTGGILWVAQTDANRISALTINHDDVTVTEHCDVPRSAPDLLAPRTTIGGVGCRTNGQRF